MKNKKIIILALVLLIIAGIIVVGLKGFNVDFMLKQHDSIEYTIDGDFDLSDIENISKDVFGDKKFKIKVIELFNDAVSINAENITTEEAENLMKKLDEKYKINSTEISSDEVVTEDTTEDTADNTLEETTSYTITSNPKIKLFSLVKPYLIPSLIAGLVIICYVGFRYKKLNAVKVVLSLIGLIVITVLSILSVIAIVRFPITIYVIPSIMFVVLIELIAFCMVKEKELNNLKEE